MLPKAASSTGEVIAEIGDWENKMNDLKKMEERELDPIGKLATLTEICTPELRDMIFYGTDMKFINQVKGEANWAIRMCLVSRTSA